MYFCDGVRLIEHALYCTDFHPIFVGGAGSVGDVSDGVGQARMM